MKPWYVINSCNIQLLDSLFSYFYSENRRSNFHDTLPPPPLHPSQEEELLRALESGDFKIALHLIPTDNPSLIRVSPDKLTPLHYACQHGRLDIIETLVIQYETTIETLMEEHYSPFHVACKYGNLEIVKFFISHNHLLKRSASTSNSTTPLHLAAENGHLHVVSHLIEHGIGNYSSPNENGDTPLHVASAHGHLSIVKYLASSASCNPAVKNTNNGQTPLHSAAKQGHLAIVQYLTEEQHCNPSCADEEGRTPLYLAAGCGRLNVIKYLINDKQCNPQCVTTKCRQDSSINRAPGRTPLHTASREGHLDVVVYLIEEQHCSPSCADEDGITPLHLAAQEGHLDIVMFLLDTGQCDPSCSRISDGITPLHSACNKGQLEVVHFLVNEKHCSPMCRTKTGLTPLHLASLIGHTQIVKFLTEDCKCDPMCLDEDQCTPLHCAAINGHIDTVKYLVEGKHCSVKSTNKRGWYPLHVASQKGHMEVVRYLCKQKECNPMCTTNTQQTPLHIASSNGQTEILKFLIENQRCDPMCLDENQGTPLHDAAFNGYIASVKYLVKGKHCSVKSTGKACWYPLHYASQNGHMEVVRYLCEQKECDPMSRTYVQQTPLHIASYHGRTEVVKFLIENQKCDPMCLDENQRTPVHYAAFNGVTATVKLLVEELGCDPLCITKQKKTPLHLASARTQVDVVRFLLSYEPKTRFCVDEEHKTPLMHACIDVKLLGQIFLRQVQNLEQTICEFLLKGANPNEINIPINTLSEKFQFLSQPYYLPLCSSAKLYIVGNKAAGKSTLVEALKREGQWFWGRVSKIKGVEPETAGVIPSTHTSELYGPVTIYDFAGHTEYYASHVSVIENATLSSQPIFIIVVDLQSSLHVLEQQLKYWNTFVTKACAQGHSPYFIIAGSHLDCMRPGEVYERTELFNGIMGKSSPSFNLLGFVLVDGQRSVSDGMSQLRKLLSKYCIPAAKQVKLNNFHTMLYAFFKWKFGGIATFQLLDIINALVEHDTPLPHSRGDVYCLCVALNTAGHILLMKDETTLEKSWIVFDQISILNHAQAFQRSESLQCGLQKGMGIVPLSKIKEYFEEKIHIDAVMKYLTHMEFCREVDTDVIKAIGFRTSTLNESHYFFPDLIRAESPQHVWDKDKVGKYCQSFAWYLSCYEPDSNNFMNPRFIQVLLLRIATKFALEPASGLKPGCTIWRNGISWFNGEGTETVVEIIGPRIEQSTAVVVLTRCQRGCEIQHYKHRSEVIETVLGVKRDKAKGVEVEEYVIHPDNIHYPLHPTAVIRVVPISQIADAVVSCKGYVVANTIHKQLPSDERLNGVLYFEPFSDLGEELLQALFAEIQQESPITDKFLEEMAKHMHHKWEVLASILEASSELVWQLQREDSSPATKCKRVLQEARRTTWGRTYGGLRKRLEKYSIFRGRNPLVCLRDLWHRHM